MSRVERAEAKLEREAKQAAQRERSDQSGKTNVKRKKKKGGCLWLLVLVLAILVGCGG